MQSPLPQSVTNARDHILAAMGQLAHAMTEDHRLDTTPMKVLIRALNDDLTMLDRITSPF